MPETSTRKLTHGGAGGPRFLVVYAGARAPQRHLLPIGRLIVGRAAGCDIVIDDATLSRQHAALTVEVDRVLIDDLESANGTLVDGEPVAAGTPVELPRGGMLALGDVVALLRDGAELPRAAADGDEPIPSSRRVVDLVAPTTLPVLILGETGAGKEVVAARIVASSTRSSAPYVRINCASLTEALVESELFGHERGAFTGADRTKQGLLEAADGGTVLLDEVGELPLSAQAKLLRVLESGEITRVGGVTSRTVDVRFIAATNRDLAEMVERGTFRADLLYRLDGVTIRVPPLRERRSEIPELAETLLAAACRASGRATPALSDEAKALLVGHGWPGNVRELRRVMERVAALVRGSRIEASDLRPQLSSAAAKRDSRTPSSLPEAVKVEVEAIERTQIEDALRRASGNQTEAAKLLGISRRTLIDRIERFGLPRPRKG